MRIKSSTKNIFEVFWQTCYVTVYWYLIFSGSAGSSAKSSSSPNGEDSRPASGQSFIRQSVDRSFGQSVLRKANQSMKSVRTNDYVDRDEDTQTSYSRESLRLLKLLFNNRKNECGFKQIVCSQGGILRNSINLRYL